MKNKGTGPRIPAGVSTWLVVLLTLAGSGALAIVAFFLHLPDLALGAVVGGSFAVLNYLGLRVLSSKLLNMGNTGKGPFWTWSLLRYGIAAVVLAVVAHISIPCLLGTLAVYLWSLGVLFWMGMKIPVTQDPS